MAMRPARVFVARVQAEQAGVVLQAQPLWPCAHPRVEGAQRRDNQVRVQCRDTTGCGVCQVAR